MKKNLPNSAYALIFAGLFSFPSTEILADIHLEGYHSAKPSYSLNMLMREAQNKADKKIIKANSLEDLDAAEYWQGLKDTLLTYTVKIEELIEAHKKDLQISDEIRNLVNNGNKEDAKAKKTERKSFIGDLSEFHKVVSNILKPKPKPVPVPNIAPGTIFELPNLNYFPAKLVLNQGQVGSCTANSLDFIIKYLTVQNSSTPQEFWNNTSRLDLNRQSHYAYTRIVEANLANIDWFLHYQSILDKDSGASMVASILTLDIFGVAPENGSYKFLNLSTPDDGGLIDYQGDGYQNISLTYKCMPNPFACVLGLSPTLNPFTKGSAFRTDTTDIPNPYYNVGKNIMYKDVTSPYRIKYRPGQLVSAQDKKDFIAQINDGLAKGRPFYVGVMLDDSFLTDDRGFIPTPNAKTFRPTGGHAITIVGYGQYRIAEKSATPDTKYYFKFINSWGPEWGDGGFGYIDANDYVAELSAFAVEGFLISLPKASS